MREFSEADKQRKKKERTPLPENPANLSPDALKKLEADVNAALKDGYLACPIGWTIAKNAGVPKIAVGSIMDKHGFRITDCQVGCFKVDKTLYTEDPTDRISEELIKIMEELNAEKNLTCEKAFELAKEYGVKPMTLGNEASARGIKIRQCQLGCF